MENGHINDDRRLLLFKAIPSALLASSVFFVSHKAFSIINAEDASIDVNNILGNPIRFNGMLKDAILNMAHLGNGYRLYNQLIFRFNGQDSESPFGGGGINAYTYCIGDPVNFTDPTGHTPAAAIVGVIAGTAGMVGNASTAWLRMSSDKTYARGGFSVKAKTIIISSVVLSAASISTAIASLAVSDDSQVKTALAVTSVVTGMLGVPGSYYGFKAMKRKLYLERTFPRERAVRYSPRLFSSRSNSDDGIFFLHNDGYRGNMYPQPLIHQQNNIHIAQNSIDSGVGRSVIDNTYRRGRDVPFTRRDDSGLGL